MSEIITIDKRSDTIYSASLYINSSSRPNLRHHVTVWFEILIEEDTFGERKSIDVVVRKASCTCESFVFRSTCKHIRQAVFAIKQHIERSGGEL